MAQLHRGLLISFLRIIVMRESSAEVDKAIEIVSSNIWEGDIRVNFTTVLNAGKRLAREVELLQKELERIVQLTCAAVSEEKFEVIVRLPISQDNIASDVKSINEEINKREKEIEYLEAALDIHRQFCQHTATTVKYDDVTTDTLKLCAECGKCVERC